MQFVCKVFISHFECSYAFLLQFVDLIGQAGVLQCGYSPYHLVTPRVPVALCLHPCGWDDCFESLFLEGFDQLFVFILLNLKWFPFAAAAHPGINKTGPQNFIHNKQARNDPSRKKILHTHEEGKDVTRHRNLSRSNRWQEFVSYVCASPHRSSPSLC